MEYIELEKLVDQENWSGLKGVVEGVCFDFKQQPYHLKTEESKHELAKDASSFLNAEGGILMLGGVGETENTHMGERLVDRKWFPKALFHQQQYKDIFLEWIFPHPEGIEFVTWAGKDESIVAFIKFPKQSPELPPFLITKTLKGAGNRTKIDMHLLGISKRVYDGSSGMEVRELHRVLRAGLSYEKQIEGKLDSLSEQLSFLLESSSATGQPLGANKLACKDPREHELLLRNRIDASLTHIDRSKPRILAVAISPIETVQLPDMFATRKSKVFELVENPPRIRDGGWDVRCGSVLTIMKGAF